ncbi:NAD(P)H-dependent oxidoreductase subunit E, partial [Escherichia coli]
APLTIRVCDSLSCAMAGAEALLAELQKRVGADVRVVRAPCVGRCQSAPAAEVGHNFIDSADVAKVAKAVVEHRHDAEIPAYT